MYVYFKKIIEWVGTNLQITKIKNKPEEPTRLLPEPPKQFAITAITQQCLHGVIHSSIFSPFFFAVAYGQVGCPHKKLG